MKPYGVPAAPPLAAKSISKLADSLLMRHAPRTLQGNGAFDVLSYVEFHLLKEHETDCRVTDQLPPGTWAETRLSLMILSEGTYLEAADDQAFARFTIAHEIGHVVLHRDLMMKHFQSSQQGTQCPLFSRGELEPYCDPEWQANEFAAALLMPQAGMISLRQRISNREVFIGVVVETFKVSYTAASYRVDKLVRRGKLSF
ncbi:MAG: ImmA/IrrE family metallo-endopeptidase [Tepidisphaeraceae bacterium]